MRSFNDITSKVKPLGSKKIAVAAAQDPWVLEAIKDAKTQGLADAILVGDAKKIAAIGEAIGLDLTAFEVVDQPAEKLAALKAVELVAKGSADMVMKGLVDTASFLRAVLDKETGLRRKTLISHVAVFEIPGFNRLLFVTDAAFNMYPDLKAKIDILNNAVEVAQAVGVAEPLVAPVCAVEVVNPDMPATLDAAILSKMNNRGQIKGCIVDGPLGLDNAISEEAARHKGITSPVAGKADIVLVPNIEVGNIMYKTLTYTANPQHGGILAGAAAPVILTSRSDTHKAKLNSIALAALVAHRLAAQQ